MNNLKPIYNSFDKMDEQEKFIFMKKNHNQETQLLINEFIHKSMNLKNIDNKKYKRI